MVKIIFHSFHNKTIAFACPLLLCNMPIDHVKIVVYILTFLVEWYLRLSFRPSLRKQPTFGDATTGFPVKWRLRNERRNSILMTCHYPDLDGASDWSCRVRNLIQPIRSTSQIWVVTRHQYGISVLFSQKSFGGKPAVASPNVGCFLRLFSRPDTVTWSVSQEREPWQPSWQNLCVPSGKQN